MWWKWQLYHVNSSDWSDVCVKSNCFGLWMVWSLQLQGLLAPFVPRRPLPQWGASLSAHMPPRGSAPAPLFIQKTPPETGDPACLRIKGILNNQGSNNQAGFGSEDAEQTRSEQDFYLQAFGSPSPPPATFICWDPQWLFQRPHGNPQKQNFLMMSP